MGNVQRNRNDHRSAQGGEPPPRPGFLKTRPPVSRHESAETEFSHRVSANRPFPAEPTD